MDRLGAIKAAKGYASGTPINYPELLAALFEDAQIDDANSGSFPLEKRLRTILAASTDNAYPWLTHFSGILYKWTDEGFRTAFKDPWPTSNNQCGHFLTAVHFGYDPSKVFAAADVMLATTVDGVPLTEGTGCRLIVGHEQVSDHAWFARSRAALASGDEARTFYNAVVQCKTNSRVYLLKATTLVSTIKVGGGEGNSRQDLHLSIFGYIFGTLIRENNSGLRTLADGSQWIRRNLLGP